MSALWNGRQYPSQSSTLGSHNYIVKILKCKFDFLHLELQLNFRVWKTNLLVQIWPKTY